MPEQTKTNVLTERRYNENLFPVTGKPYDKYVNEKK